MTWKAEGNHLPSVNASGKGGEGFKSCASCHGFCSQSFLLGYKEDAVDNFARICLAECPPGQVDEGRDQSLFHHGKQVCVMLDLDGINGFSKLEAFLNVQGRKAMYWSEMNLEGNAKQFD